MLFCLIKWYWPLVRIFSISDGWNVWGALFDSSNYEVGVTKFSFFTLLSVATLFELHINPMRVICSHPLNLFVPQFKLVNINCVNFIIESHFYLPLLKLACDLCKCIDIFKIIHNFYYKKNIISQIIIFLKLARNTCIRIDIFKIKQNFYH